MGSWIYLYTGGRSEFVRTRPSELDGWREDFGLNVCFWLGGERRGRTSCTRSDST